MLAASLAVMTAIAVTGCQDSKQAAIDAFEQASQRLSQSREVSIENMDFNVAMELPTSGSAQETASIQGTMNLQYVLPADDEDVLDTQMAMDFSGTVLDEGRTQDFSMGVYMADKALYVQYNGLDQADPSTTFKFKYDLSSYSGTKYGDIVNALNEEKQSDKDGKFELADYVKSGSLENGKITLQLDTKPLIFAALNEAMSYTGGSYTGSESSLFNDDQANIENNLKLLNSLIKSDNTTITAMLNDDGSFKSFETSMDIDMDASVLLSSQNLSSSGSSSLYGNSSSSTTLPDDPSGSLIIKVTAKISCPSIETNMGKSIEFPDFSDYVDLSDYLDYGNYDDLTDSLDPYESYEDSWYYDYPYGDESDSNGSDGFWDYDNDSSHGYDTTTSPQPGKQLAA